MLNKCLLKEQPNICTVNKALCYTLAHFILKEPFAWGGKRKTSWVVREKLRLGEESGLHNVPQRVGEVLGFKAQSLWLSSLCLYSLMMALTS